MPQKQLKLYTFVGSPDTWADFSPAEAIVNYRRWIVEETQALDEEDAINEISETTIHELTEDEMRTKTIKHDDYPEPLLYEQMLWIDAKKEPYLFASTEQ